MTAEKLQPDEVQEQRRLVLAKYIAKEGITASPEVKLCNPATKLTVVVPAFNEADFIGTTILSLGQSETLIEIVVIDNGSTDHTKQVALEAAQRIQYPVSILDCVQKGPVFARKRGMDEVVAQYVETGNLAPRYIAMTDADTVVPKDWASSICSTFEQTQSAGLGGAYGFAESLDSIVQQATGIDHYFAYLPRSSFYLTTIGASLAQTRGANAAIEVVSYALIGGSRQPLNENGKPTKGSDVRFGNALREMGQRVGFIPVITETSARRSIFALAKGVDQATISTMADWVDCRDPDERLLKQIINQLDPDMLKRHQKERLNAYTYSAVIMPILTGNLDIHGLVQVLGDAHPMVASLERAKLTLSAESIGMVKLWAREAARQFSGALHACVWEIINHGGIKNVE